MGFREARQRAGKSVAEVVEHMGVSSAAINQWENGVFLPTSDKLPRLANFYGCTIEFLLTGNPVSARKQAD